MKLYVDAVVTNEFNQVLLIMRDDSRTWAQPGGSVELGETPPQALEREVLEETGLKVFPVRLVALHFRPEKPDGTLMFTFRCIQKGGQLATSPESPRVSFLPVTPLPQPMLGVHRQRVERALAHSGGSVVWAVQEMPAPLRLLRKLLYRGLHLARRVRDREPFQPAPEWKAGAFVVIQNEEGLVLWVKRRDRDVWNLPGGQSEAGETPWRTAVRETKEETGLTVALTDLTGVYTKTDRRTVLLTFTATVTGGALTANAEACDFAYFVPGQEPPNTLPKHIARVADAVGARARTHFREQGTHSREEIEREE